MQRRQGTGHAQRVLGRWFLPLLVAVAVLAMHGLGHPSGHAGHMAGMAAAAPPHTARMPAPQVPASGPAMVGRDVTGTPAPGGLDPVAVCLAVLAGTLLLLLPLLRRSGRLPCPAQALARGRAGRLQSGRSPPRAPALCALQVLRL